METFVIFAQVTMMQFCEGIQARVVPTSGEKILWIHGYTMDSSLWRPLWSHLSGWHHIGIDLPGHGASDPLSDQESLPGLARRLGEAALVYEVRHLVGLSFGAIIALQMALEFPGVFTTVSLGAAGLTGGPEDPHTRPRYRQLIQLYFQRGAGPWLTECWMQWPPEIFKGAAAHPDLWQALVSVINRHTWAEIGNFAMLNLTGYRQIEHVVELAKVESAVLLLLGEAEMPAFQEAAAILQRHLPDCQTICLPHAGHLCLLEQPEAAARHIAAHLKRVNSNQ